VRQARVVGRDEGVAEDHGRADSAKPALWRQACAAGPRAWHPTAARRRPSCTIAAHAARRRDSDDLLRIRSALEKLREATRNHEHREDADFEFHLAIAQASNNHYFATALNALHDHVAVGMKLHGLAVSGPRSELVSVYEEHSAIHTAIVAGDAAGAAEAMLAHLNSSRGRLFEGHALALTKQDKGLRE